MNILLLEDDIALNKAIKKVLELDHHTVKTFLDGQVLLESLEKRYDLYILDINVPHISGLELLDIILLQNDQAKVIMISSNTDVESLQTAYNLGCVDYLKKPFHIAELRAKINRFKLSIEHLFAGIKLKKNSEILTKKEKKLLNLLLDNLTLVVNYEMIENHVYENKPMTMDALRALIRRLRVKLAEDIIHNIVDEGYSILTVPTLYDEKTETDIQKRMETLEEENIRLKWEKKVLLTKSITDPLTRLYNRDKIQEIFLYEQEKFIRYGDPLSIILMDLDDFKSVNDLHGHNAGDQYLKEVAQTLSGFFRTVDIVGRWGGEEFIILLPNTSLDELRKITIKLKESINSMNFPKIGFRTASYGLSTLYKGDTLNSIVHRADKALLLAKAQGKNNVK